MKLSADGIWVHIACVTWNPNLLFQNIDTMQPCEIRPLLESSEKHRCIVCRKCVGVPVKCSDPRCQNYLHVTCAQDQGCVLDAVTSGDGVIFTLTCKAHSYLSSASQEMQPLMQPTSAKVITDEEMKEFVEELEGIDWSEVQEFGRESGVHQPRRERNETNDITGESGKRVQLS